MAATQDQITAAANAITRRRRPSAVSQVLKAITVEEVREEVWKINAGDGRGDFSIRVASDQATRRRAYALAWRVYHRAGYVQGEADGLCVSAYDAFTGTVTLLAQDSSGRDVGTISIVFDSSLGLPCNEIYREEVDLIRAEGRMLVEFTRLAIEDDVPNARTLMMYMFSMAYIFGRHVGRCSDILIEVNPRHVEYYKRLLRFETVGPERPCPRVKGAPAVLLKMDCAGMDLAQQSNMGGRDAQGRRLHPYPFSVAEQHKAADFLSRHHRPMTLTEMQSFNIDRCHLATAGV
ncbi:MAG TPA: hypothetical protein VEJ63_13365 [Planctomycetota bacterium]|nr:hypothetical protein [Planctomycetota bacterium]